MMTVLLIATATLLQPPDAVAALTANVPDARVIELPPSTGNAAGTPFGIVAG